MQYFKNILIWLTQGFNTLLGGSPDESTSSRAYRLRERAFWKYMYNFINFVFKDPNHCYDSYVIEAVKKEAWLRHMETKLNS